MKEGVTYKRLGEVAPSIKYDGEIVPKNGMFWLLNLDMVEANTGKVLDKVYVSKGELDGSITPFSPDNVLYSKLRPYLNKVVLPDEHGYCTTELVPLYPQKDQISREYLAYFLRSNTFVGVINEKVAGAKMPRVKMSDFWNYPIPVPSLSFQEQVVKELDGITNIIADKKQQLIELDKLAQAIFSKMFGNLDSSNFPIVKMHDVANFLNGDRSKNYPSGDDIVAEGVPFINTGHLQNERVNFSKMEYITNEKFETLRAGKIQYGDILFCLRGSLGKLALIDFEGKGAIASSLVIIRPKANVNSHYLRFYLSSDFVKVQIVRANNGSSQPNLSAKSVSDFRLPLPPLDLQLVFDEKIRAIEEQKDLIQQSIAEFENLLAQRMEFHFA